MNLKVPDDVETRRLLGQSVALNLFERRKHDQQFRFYTTPAERMHQGLPDVSMNIAFPAQSATHTRGRGRTSDILMLAAQRAQLSGSRMIPALRIP